MPAFTDLAGIPMTAHVPLLRGWLRERLGFDGVIVSDYNAIAELIKHGVAADLVEAAALALNAGVDIDMMADAYRKGLPEALERGLVDDGERSTRRCGACWRSRRRSACSRIPTGAAASRRKRRPHERRSAARCARGIARALGGAAVESSAARCRFRPHSAISR